jgi:hypothetical protein
VTDVHLTAAPVCAIEWSWDTSTKTWLVQAVSLRDGGRSVVAECNVVRADPLPDYILASLLSATVDYWAAIGLF